MISCQPYFNKAEKQTKRKESILAIGEARLRADELPVSFSDSHLLCSCFVMLLLEQGAAKRGGPNRDL